MTRLAIVAALVLSSLATAAEPPTPEAKKVEFFENKIRPVLVEHCYKCHSEKAEKLQGKLLLDSREAARKGGESGAAIVPGDPDGSLLVQALRFENFEMPPGGKLPAEVIADFERWIGHTRQIVELVRLKQHVQPAEVVAVLERALQHLVHFGGQCVA